MGAVGLDAVGLDGEEDCVGFDREEALVPRDVGRDEDDGLFPDGTSITA